MQVNKIKVLYIAGYSFSGSTILANILGEIEGFFSAGELRCIWEENLIKNFRCGCGSRFHDCSFWQEVFNKYPGGMQHINAQEIVGLQEKRKHFPLMLLPGNKQVLKPRFKKYLSSIEKLYQAIQSTTGSKVIVDSSKSPLYSYTLSMVPTIDLYIVHLVRDPRAVQYSCIKRKLRKKHRWEEHSIVEGCLTWNACNSAVELFWRSSPNHYLRLHYEDFIQRPKAALQQILQLVQEDITQLPIEGENIVNLTTNHTAIGNNNRFHAGATQLKIDEQWKEKMSVEDRQNVTNLTLPWLLYYGYLNKNKFTSNYLKST
ncbi:sulfotransferase [Gloeocapsa sp. BRSZ]